MNNRILKHFGIDRKGFYRDKDYNVLAKDICGEILDNNLVVIAGQWGAGKTELFKDVKRALSMDPDSQPIFVRVANEEKEKLRIGSILTAVLYELTQEAPRHDLEARSRQVIRIIGEKVVNARRKVVVFIENAHRLHVNTIRAIKDFRENDFAGVSPLFAVVLVGQEPLIEKVNRFGEVRCRTSMYELNEANGWFTYEKRVAFLETVYGEAVTKKARTRLASLYRTPLAMTYVVEKKMEDAYKAGLTQVDETLLEMNLRELYNALNESDPVGYREIAQRAGVALGTVSNVMTGIDHRNQDKIKEALAQVERERQIGIHQKAVNQ